MRLNGDRQALLNKVRAEMERDGFAEDEIQLCLSLAEKIALGNLPNKCEDNFFVAFSWLVSIIGEPIHLTGYSSVRDFDFFHEIGIWPLLLENMAPFSVPRADTLPPGVGYLPWQSTRDKTAEEIEQQLKAASRLSEHESFDQGEVSYGRQQFSEVVESLAGDQMDLLVIT